MELNEKLQELRKQKGLTQQELAQILCVSRTAVSKWESGRGYPNIDSLKAIAKLFSVTVDQLLSGEQLLDLAKEDNKRKEDLLKDRVFGLLDISVAMLFFLPFFAQRTIGLESVSVTSVKVGYLLVIYLVLLVLTVALGALTLVLQNCNFNFWTKVKVKASVILNILCVLVFIASLQPYAATFSLVLLMVKLLLLIKK